MAFPFNRQSSEWFETMTRTFGNIVCNAVEAFSSYGPLIEALPGDGLYSALFRQMTARSAVIDKHFSFTVRRGFLPMPDNFESPLVADYRDGEACQYDGAAVVTQFEGV